MKLKDLRVSRSNLYLVAHRREFGSMNPRRDKEYSKEITKVEKDLKEFEDNIYKEYSIVNPQTNEVTLDNEKLGIIRKAKKELLNKTNSNAVINKYHFIMKQHGV